VNSKEYRFYCPFYNTRIVDARNVIGNFNFSGSDFSRKIEFEKTQDLIELCKDKEQMIIV